MLFPYSRPDKFIQVVSALKTQSVDHVIVFIDGPKDDTVAGRVEECKAIARGIDWATVDCFFKDKNEGPDGFIGNLEAVFRSYDSAIILEEDCVPMPSFYSVMKKALHHYRKDKRVFSIGGYQHIAESFFEAYPYTFVSTSRFSTWGCALWRDRWNMISPFLYGNRDGLKDIGIPDDVGDDFVSSIRLAKSGARRAWEALSWDTKIAVLALYFNKAHLILTKGLIRNIGVDAGIHFAADPLTDVIFNRNVYDKTISDIVWLEDTKPNKQYNRRARTTDNSVYNYFLAKAASGGSKTDGLTLAQIIAKVPKIMVQLKNNPVRTTKRIARAIAPGPVNVVIGFRRKRSITGYDEYLPRKQDTGNRSALLSYLVEPLRAAPRKRDRAMFSNRGIAQYIPRALNELGYVVDIVNYDNREFKVKTGYDLFIGHAGMNFEPIHHQLPPETVSIYFSTATYWESFNRWEKERFENLFQRRGIVLPYDRYIADSQEFANRNADGIICLGNDNVRQTYAQFPLVLSLNNAAFPDNGYNYAGKDFEIGRNNFLFYSGPGNVHKGLDLLLDVFLQTKNHLYICTAIEPLFEKAFYDELHNTANIHLVGNIHLHDRRVHSVIDRCNFVIHPSCAEGQPGSVIECLHKGVIPIVSRQANIDTDDFGITLESVSVQDILRVVEEASDMPAHVCKDRSMRTRRSAQEYYTEERFLQSMKNAIDRIREQTRKKG